MIAKTIEEVRECVSKYVGKSFPYYSRYEYPHGQMKQAKLLSIDELREGRMPSAHLEITFTDGFTADYSTGLTSLYEHVIINLDDDEPQAVCVSRVRFNTWTQYQRAKDFFDSSGLSRLWAGDWEDSSLTIEFCDGVTIEEMETTLREELRRANLTGYEIKSITTKV